MSDIQNLIIDIDLKENILVTVTCKQLDNLNLIFNIWNSGIQADLSNYRCRLKALKQDQIPLIQNTDITINNNVVTIIADQQLTTTSGVVKTELQFIDKISGEKKSTFNLNIKVIASVLEVDRTISKATITLLEELDNKIDEIEDIGDILDEAKTVRTNLELDITNANTTKTNLNSSIFTANTTKSALDTSNATANTTKAALNTSITNANNSKTALDTSKTNADASKVALDTSIANANTFVSQHGDIIDLDNRVTQNTSQLLQKANQSDLDATNNVVALKADTSYVNAQIQNMNNTVQGFYATTEALNSDFPSGNSNNYVVIGDATNLVYRWNGSAWISTGYVWGNDGIMNNSITDDKINNTYKIDMSLKLNRNNFSISGKIDGSLTMQDSSYIINTGICKIPLDCDYIYVDAGITDSLVSLFFLNGDTLSTNSIINKYGENKAIKQAIKIPTNATHFLMQRNKINIDNDSIFFVKNNIQLITNDDMVNNLQITNTGTIVTSYTSVYSSDFISLEDVYKIKVSGFVNNRNIINYYSKDSYDNWISGDAPSLKVNFTSTIPLNAKYCIIQMSGDDTNNTPSFVELYKKTKSATSQVNRLKNYVDVSYLLKNRYIVSNTKEYLCGGDPCSILDKQTGLVYMTYLASRTKYGENRDIIALSIFPLLQPFDVEYYEIAVDGDIIGSSKIVKPFEPNLVDLGDKVRIFFTTNENVNTNTYWGYMYRDFNKDTKMLEENVHTLKLNINNTIGRFSFNDVANYITTNGGSFISDYIELKLAFTSRIVTQDDVYYGIITSNKQCPVLVKSTDCETWEAFNIINESVVYESQLEIVGNRMYVLNRGVTNNFYISEDNGVTFAPNTIQLNIFNSRPQVIRYKDGLLILRSDDTSDYKYQNEEGFYSGRYNLFIDFVTANGQNLQKKIKIESKYTLGYYSVIDNHNDIYISYHNGELFRHQHNKDCISFVKIGDLKNIQSLFEDSV